MGSTKADIKIILGIDDQATGQLKGAMSSLKGSSMMDVAIISSTFSQMGSRMTSTVQDITGSFATFDQSMANTKSIASGTDSQFEALRKQAMEMSKEMPASAKEIADGYYFLASAGYDANTILEQTPAILQLATATATDFSTSANLVTSSLDVFAQQGYSTNEITDTLMNTVKGFKTTLGELGESYKYSAASAAAAGISFETLGAATGIIRGSFADASQAGTAMRMMLQQLANPTSDASALMEEYGLHIQNNADGTLNLAATMENFKEGLDALPPGLDRVGALQEIFGVRAATAADALIRNSGELANYETELGTSGAVIDAFNKQMEGTANQLEIANNKMEDAKIEIGEAFAPGMILAANASSYAAESFANLPKPLLEVAGGFMVVGGQAMNTIAPILMSMASLQKLYPELVSNKTALLKYGIAAAAAIGFMGAMTSDTLEMRLAFSALTAATVAYTVAKWAASAAELTFWEIATVGVATGAIVMGITMGMATLANEHRKAKEEETKALEGYDDVLNITKEDMQGLVDATDEAMEGMNSSVTGGLDDLGNTFKDGVGGLAGDLTEGLASLSGPATAGGQQLAGNIKAGFKAGMANPTLNAIVGQSISGEMAMAAGGPGGAGTQGGQELIGALQASEAGAGLAVDVERMLNSGGASSAMVGMYMLSKLAITKDIVDLLTGDAANYFSDPSGWADKHKVDISGIIDSYNTLPGSRMNGVGIGTFFTPEFLNSMAQLGGGDFRDYLLALGSGGIVNQPTVALIGERGPEAVVPLDKYPMGGGVNIQNIHIYADTRAGGEAAAGGFMDALQRAGVAWR